MEDLNCNYLKSQHVIHVIQRIPGSVGKVSNLPKNSTRESILLSCVSGSVCMMSSLTDYVAYEDVAQA